MGTGESDVNCKETVERLYHYLDGELTDERRREIKRHLDDCPPCLDAFDFEAELRQVVADRCRDRVPDALRDRIRLALEAESERDSAST
jgi:mycothiol system anti-sigma-R factor